jgi:hypothetical protein
VKPKSEFIRGQSEPPGGLSGREAYHVFEDRNAALGKVLASLDGCAADNDFVSLDRRLISPV